MEICTNTSVLTIIRLLLIVFNVIKIVIPLILIIIVTIDVFKAIVSNEDNALSKVIKNSTNRLVAAILIFFVPTIVFAIINVIHADNTILACFQNANSNKIQELYIENANSLIDNLSTTLNSDDYYIAIRIVNKIKSEEIKNSYLNKLDSIKEKINYNEILDSINIAKKTLNKSDYNNAINKISSLTDESQRQELINSLNETKYLVDLKEEILHLSNNDSNYNTVKTKVDNISNEEVRKEFLSLLGSYNPPATKLNVASGAFEKSFEKMSYYEVIPQDAEENMPIIIFLHGYTENMGMSILKNITICKYVASNEAFKVGKFIFVAPLTNSGWNEGNIKKLIDSKVEEYKINKKRIIITGHSMGGNAVWHLVNKYPNYFAAAMPMSYPPYETDSSKTGCSYYTKPFADVNNFKTTPIYAIHGEDDNCRELTEKFVKTINENGGKAIMDVRKEKNHSTIREAYSAPDLYKWMLSQKRK